MTENPENNLVYLLMRGYRWFERGIRDRLDEIRDLPELTPSQLLTIASLDPEGTSPSELARRLGTSRQAAHQATRELARLGLVELVADPGDRRVRRARLTARGRRLDRMAVETIHDLERALAERIGQRSVAALRAALERDWERPG